MAKQEAILEQKIENGFWVWPDGQKTSIELIKQAIQDGWNDLPKGFYDVCAKYTEDWIRQMASDAKTNGRKEHEKYPDRFYDEKGNLSEDGKAFPQKPKEPRETRKPQLANHKVTVEEIGGAVVLQCTQLNIQNLVYDGELTPEKVRTALIKRLRIEDSEKEPRSQFTVTLVGENISTQEPEE